MISIFLIGIKLWTWTNHFQTCIELSIIYPNFSPSFETSYIIFMSLPFLLWTLTLNKTLPQIEFSYEYQLIGYIIFLNFSLYPFVLANVLKGFPNRPLPFHMLVGLNLILISSQNRQTNLYRFHLTSRKFQIFSCN